MKNNITTWKWIFYTIENTFFIRWKIIFPHDENGFIYKMKIIFLHIEKYLSTQWKYLFYTMENIFATWWKIILLQNETLFSPCGKWVSSYRYGKYYFSLFRWSIFHHVGKYFHHVENYLSLRCKTILIIL